MTRRNPTGGLAARKQSLREQMRERRRALSASEQASHANAVAKTVVARLQDGDTVGVYLVRDGELDLTPLIEICWQRGIAVAVPVIDGQQLRFAAYRRNEPMRRNRFGIAEPAEPAWRTPTLLLAPLVAFDATGQRLGMGGGYYDRYLSAHPDLRRVGAAHECQRVAAVPAADDDVPLPAVVTERGWQSFTPLADTR
ncbi:MAG: 5-formyltetrahydrofolate cyclo-ligase [Gammaproteobacteria bacterium]|nr:5-formyltetrahydrofolate cyclo-ligase [Gammaproteobacteria bacterium]